MLLGFEINMWEILQPIIFLHGGPGSGTSGGNRRFFDPEHYRIILFDQVGCCMSLFYFVVVVLNSLFDAKQETGNTLRMDIKDDVDCTERRGQEHPTRVSGGKYDMGLG